MKLLYFRKEGISKLGVLDDTENFVYSIKDFGINYDSMNDLIEHITNEEFKILKDRQASNVCTYSIDEVEILSPIPNPKQDIICLGINYMEHAKESAKYKKEEFGGERPYAVYFSKRAAETVGQNGYIDSHSDMVERLDYEAELAFIIGKDCKNVDKENVRDYIFGYTIMNDVSARDVQIRHKQWYFGKSLDGFTPLGPYIVTADEIAYPPKLTIQSKINGELRQNSNTDLLIFGIDHIVSELSKGMTLKAGTIIATGTPAGVGMGFQPPKFLKAGDEVECIIEKIGTLRNIVK